MEFYQIFKIMKKLGIALIIILGALLRVVMLDKPEGLWNDEYVSYMISAQPLWEGFVNGIKSQCHMPFYYIYLKVVMSLFGQSDLVLRLSSVIAGVLAIPVMYLVGCEKDIKTGMYCAVFTSISSFLIYYSQEVRLYSLLFLISAVTLLFTLRLVKNPDRKNLIYCLIANFFILFTHTIGFVFVFFNLIYISYKLYKQHKEIILKMWAIIGVLLLLLIPEICLILFKKTFSQWWGTFSPSVFGFLITDYFSPVITNFTGAPANFFYNFKSGFIIFALMPALIAVLFVAQALKEKVNRELFYVTLGTVAVLAIASMAGKLVFITKYSIEIYPILILLACSGASSIKSRALRNTAVTIFCLLNLFFLAVSPLAANRLPRKEGHNIAAQLIKNQNLKPGDIIILQYYGSDRFNKYYDFAGMQVISMNKANFADYIKPNVTYSEAFANGKMIFRDKFSVAENEYFKTKLQQDVDLKDNQSVLLLVLKSVSFFDKGTIQKIAQNDGYYTKTPLFFMVFSYLKNETYKALSERYVITGHEEKGEWAVVKFTKVHN